MTAERADGFTFTPETDASPPTARVSDIPAWCLALLPLAATLVETAAIWASPGQGLSGSAVNAGVSAALFWTAWRDAKTIESEGANPRRLHLTWWGLVTPVYLVQRARALRRGWIFPAVLVGSIVPMLYLQAPGILGGNVYFSLPRCNDAAMLKKLVDIANEAYRAKNVAVTMNVVDAVSEKSVADKVRTCAATAHFSDGEVLPVTFTINEEGDSYWIHITEIGTGT